MKDLNNINDWKDITEHQKLGEIFMQAGKLNLIQLGMALDVQKFQPLPLGEVLLNMKVITQDELDRALELQEQIDNMIDERG